MDYYSHLLKLIDCHPSHSRLYLGLIKVKYYIFFQLLVNLFIIISSISELQNLYSSIIINLVGNILFLAIYYSVIKDYSKSNFFNISFINSSIACLLDSKTDVRNQKSKLGENIQSALKFNLIDKAELNKVIEDNKYNPNISFFVYCDKDQTNQDLYLRIKSIQNFIERNENIKQYLVIFLVQFIIAIFILISNIEIGEYILGIIIIPIILYMIDYWGKSREIVTEWNNIINTQQIFHIQ